MISPSTPSTPLLSRAVQQIGAWLDCDGDGHITLEELMAAIKESFQAKRSVQAQGTDTKVG